MSRVALALAALCVSGCFTKPPFGSGGDDDPSGDGGVDDAGPDASTVDGAPAGTCGSPYSDTFAAASAPCGAWGTLDVVAPATVARDLANGVLAVTIASGMMGGSGGCTSGEFAFTNGASIRLVQPITGAQYASHFVSLHGMASAKTTNITIQTGTQPYLQLSTGDGSYTMASYEPSAMQWFRFRPLDDQRLAVEYSGDGTQWTLLGNDDHGATIGAVSLVFGASGGYTATPATARWDDFNVKTCPP